MDEDSPTVTRIHGRWYDVSSFESLHPGGPVALALSYGRDGTALFEAHHPFTSRVRLRGLLAPLEVTHDDALALDARFPHAPAEGALYDWSAAEGELFATSNAPARDVFETDVKAAALSMLVEESKRCGCSIRDAGKAPTLAWLQFILLGVTFLFCGALPLVRGESSALLTAPVLCWLWMIGYWHDASHFAFSTSWGVNFALQYTLPVFSSPLIWAHQHLIGHHPYTSLPGRDPDLYHSPILWRLSHDVAWAPIHAFQLWYTPILWLVAVPSLLFTKGIEAVISNPVKLNHSVPLMAISKTRIALHVLGRLYALYVVYLWPFFLFPLRKAFCFAVIPISIFSLLFMFASQVNHHVADAVPPYLEVDKVQPRTLNWWRHQCTASHTVAPHSRWMLFISGGLNLQIEHHLFPMFHQTRLALIQPAIEAAAKKHGVPYPQSLTLVQALRKYCAHLLIMGARPVTGSSGLKVD